MSQEPDSSGVATCSETGRLSLRAIEFFSGIGAFRAVAPEFAIKVIQAFDQSQDANLVYAANFDEQVCTRNLESISASEIPDADFWWMSPPCKPFSRRGKQGDVNDPRAAALLNLIKLIEEKTPSYIALENVLGFEDSEAEALLLGTLFNAGYKFRKVNVCPTQFGIPMQRPRLILVASRAGQIQDFDLPDAATQKEPLQMFLLENSIAYSNLELDPRVLKKYHDSLHIIKANDPRSQCICFTSGYGKSLKASGSYLETASGAIRYFAPEEILALLGFNKEFHFPDTMSLAARWRLVGNTVELRSLRAALSILLQNRIFTGIGKLPAI
jgi:DNA (cytosine-5)-methyltransferase 1